MPLPGSKFVPGETTSLATPQPRSVEFGVPLVAPPTATRTPVTPIEGSPLKAFGNLSAQLGGGQYSIGQTGQDLIKSERTFDALTRARLRGGLSSQTTGIDHIIPLWAGGTNDPSNIQLLPTAEMDKKSTIDNLVYQLYKNNYVSLGQSRLITKNWNSNPLDSLSPDIVRKALNDPSIPETITLEDKTYAIKDTLRNPPRVDRPDLGHELTGNLGTNVFKTLQKGLNVVEAGIGGLAYGIISAFQGKNPVKAGVQYAKDVMAGKEGVFNQPAFTEAGKGILGGYTGHWLNPEATEYTNPVDQTVAKVARLGGEAVGTVLGFKAIGKGITKIFGAPKIAESAIMQTLGKSTVAKVIQASPLTKSILTNSGLFATYGQLSRQEENTLEARGKRLISDIAMGTFFGALGYTLGAKLPPVKQGQISVKNITVGTLANAYAGYGIAKMEGADEEDALLNAGIFAALHGYGLYENRFAIKAQKSAEQKARNLFESFGTESKMRTPTEINNALWDMRNTINQEINDGRMTQENASWLLQRGLVAAKTLSYPMMPLRQRLVQEWEDISSVFERTAQRQQPQRGTTRTAEVPTAPVTEPRTPASVVPNSTIQFLNRVREVETNPQLRTQLTQEAQTVIAPEEIDPLITERVMSTGMGESVNSQANRNQRQLIQQWEQAQIDPAIPQPEIWLVRRDLTDHPNIPEPTAVQIIQAMPDGSTRHLGWIPTEENVRRYQNRPDRPVDLPPFNPDANQLAFGTAMDDLGVGHVRANIEYARISDQSNQPYMVINVSPERWSDAVALERVAPSTVPQPVATKSREEYFSVLPDDQSKISVVGTVNGVEKSIIANNAEAFVEQLNALGRVAELTPALRQALPNLTYGDLFDLYKAANQHDALTPGGKVLLENFADFFNQFREAHGQAALERFIATKIVSELPAPTTPVPEAVTAISTSVATPSVPTVVPVTPTTQPTPPILPPTEAPVPKAAVAVEPVEPRVEAVKQETIKTADPKRMFINKTAMDGKQPVNQLDYSNFGYGDGKTYNAFGRIIANKVIDLVNGGEAVDSPKLTDLYNFSKTLTRREMQRRAKGVVSYEEFRDEYLKQADKLDLHLIQSRDQNQRFKRVYNLLRETRPRKWVLATSDGINFAPKVVNNYDPASPYRKEILAGVREFDFSVNDMFPIGFQTINAQGKNVSAIPRKLGFSFGEQVENIFKAMLQTRTMKIGQKTITGKIFPMADQNGIPGNTMGIFLSDSAQKSLLVRYDKNPKKYEAVPQWKENLSKELPSASVSTDTAKIYAVLTKDVLKINMDAANFLKRVNIFDHRGLQWNEDGRVRIIVMPDITLKELAAIHPEFLPDYAKLDPEKYGNFLTSKIWGDGGSYLPKELLTRIQDLLGFPGENMNIKGTLAHKISDAEGLFMEKSNTSVVSEAMREFLRSRFNYETRPDEIYTFNTNIKTGKNTTELTALPGTNGLKAIEVPRRAFRYIYENPPAKQRVADEIRVTMDQNDAVASGVDTDAAEADSGTFSLTLLMQFSNKDTANVNGQPVLIDPYLEAIYKPAFKKWSQAWIEGATGEKSPTEVVKEYYDMNSLGWGELKKMSEANAPLSDLRKQFETQMLKILREEVLRNREMNSAYLKMVPDLGFLDPLESKRRMLKPGSGPDEPGEVMISSELWKELGRPEYLFTNRYPTLSKLAMSKVRVLIAEDYGISNLGRNQVVLNTWDAFLRKQGDFDGDGLTVFRVISKDRADTLMAQGKPLDGIPEPIADHIEQQRWQYIEQSGGEFNPEMITVPDHANPGQIKTLNLAGPESKYPELPITAETLLYIAKQHANAKQQIGGITNAKNLARIMIDNGFEFEGRKPAYTSDIENATGALAQATVDATSRKVFGQLQSEEGNAWAAIFGTTDQGFLDRLRLEVTGGTNPKTKQRKLGTYLNGLRPLRPSTSTSSITYGTVAELKNNAIDPFLTTVPQDPTKQHVLQKLWLSMKDLQPSNIDNKINWEADQAAVKKVTADMPAPGVTRQAQEFIDGIKTIQKNKAEARLNRGKDPDTYNYWRSHDRFFELYYDKADQFTQADKKAISWFLLTDKLGNVWYDEGYKGPETLYNFERLYSLVLPEHLQPYFTAKREYLRNLGQAPEAPATAAAALQPPTPQPPISFQERLKYDSSIYPLPNSVMEVLREQAKEQGIHFQEGGWNEKELIEKENPGLLNKLTGSGELEARRLRGYGPLSKKEIGNLIKKYSEQKRPQTVATSFKELGKVLRKPQTQFPKVAETITTKTGVKLAKEVNPDGTYWLEQNIKKPSRWTNLAKQGHKIEHLFLANGTGYAGKIRIDGTEYTYAEAEKKFGV